MGIAPRAREMSGKLLLKIHFVHNRSTEWSPNRAIIKQHFSLLVVARTHILHSLLTRLCFISRNSLTLDGVKYKRWISDDHRARCGSAHNSNLRCLQSTTTFPRCQHTIMAPTSNHYNRYQSSMKSHCHHAATLTSWSEAFFCGAIVKVHRFTATRVR